MLTFLWITEVRSTGLDGPASSQLYVGYQELGSNQ